MTTPSLHQHLFIGLPLGPSGICNDFTAPCASPSDTHCSCKLTRHDELFPPQSPPHSSSEAQSGLTQAPGPTPASHCLCSALEPSRFLPAASWEGLRRRMHCFMPSSLNRNDPLPFLHFTPCLYSVVAHFTAS